MSTRQFGGVSRFLELLDAPNSYVGQAGLYARVNATEDGLEFAAGGGGGSQTPWLSDIDAAGYDLNNLNVLQAQSLYDPANNFVANLSSGKLSDLIGVGSVDVENRELIDSSGTVKLNWAGPALFLDDRVIIGGGSDDGINDLQLAGSNSIIFGSQITQSLLGTVFNFNNPAFAQANAELNLWTQSDGVTALSNGDVLTWDAANSRWAGAAGGGGGGAYALLDGSNQPFTGNVTLQLASPRLTIVDTSDIDNPTSYIEKLTSGNTFRLVSQNRLYTVPNGLTLAGATAGTGLSYTSTGALSVSFWWKTSNSGDSYFIGNSTATSDFRWGSSILSFNDEAAGLSRQWTAGAFNNNTWRHIVLTISADRLTVKAYINAVEASVSQAGTVGGNFIINRIFATNGSTNGSFDDFRILTRELTPAEITAIYNGGAPVETTDMTDMYAYYKLNATSGTSVADSSGNGRTVTLVGGTPVWSTGIVATIPNLPGDVPILTATNNTIASSYATVQLGYFDASRGTTNIYEGLSHQLNILGVSKLYLDSTTLTVNANAQINGAVSISANNNLTMAIGGGRFYVGSGGTGANPAISQASDTNSGININNDQIDFCTGGIVRVQLSNSTTRMQFGSVSVPGIGHVGDTDQGIYGNVGIVGVSTGNYSTVAWTTATTTHNNTTSNVFNINAVETFRMGTTESVFNESGANRDFRIEGDTNVNLFFVDASADFIGIGTNTPGYLFDVNGASHFSGQITLDDDLNMQSGGEILFSGTSIISNATMQGDWHFNTGSVGIGSAPNILYSLVTAGDIYTGGNFLGLGFVDVSGGYKVGGTAGITSSGSFSNFTIVGGIITAAS
jgi:hypothetical protein